MNADHYMTLGELKSVVHPTTGVTAPTIKQLEARETPIVTYRDRGIRIAVFPSGFVTAHLGRSQTIFRIEDCGEYTYRFAKRFPEAHDATKHHFDADYFLNQRWELRVLMEAEDRLERNNDRYEYGHAARF